MRPELLLAPYLGDSTGATIPADAALPKWTMNRSVVLLMGKYYAPGENRSAKVQDLFARIAPRYDLINDLQSFGMHRWWKRRMIALSNPRTGEAALDLCCGTGDVAMAYANKGVDVVGLDFSAPMLEVAEQRLTQPAVKNSLKGAIRFIRGDAQQIPFPDSSFDIVTMSYGLRNLADWEKGLGEMLRVCKPGGRLLVLDFGKPENALLRSLYFGYLRFVVPVLGRLFCGDADTHGYILESLKNYAAQRGVESKMKELGLLETRVLNLVGGAMSINYGVKPQG